MRNIAKLYPLKRNNVPNQKDLNDFQASGNILAINIEMFHKGNRELYRVIAVELRKLLCDGKQSLLTRLFPLAVLHPLRGKLPESLKRGLVFHMPAKVEFDGQGGSRIVELFNIKAQPIPLQEWLEQDLFSPTVSIKELIRSVADKEGAHSDKEFNDTLKMSQSIKLVDEEIHKQHIVAIGEYILLVVNEAIDLNPNEFGRK
jgi:hypothetical protein